MTVASWYDGGVRLEEPPSVSRSLGPMVAFKGVVTPVFRAVEKGVEKARADKAAAVALPAPPTEKRIRKRDVLFSACKRIAAFLRPRKKWPYVGGTSAYHPMAGPWPKPPTRELWAPPPGWTPPKKPVFSWYDKGLRLVDASAVTPEAPAVASWFDAGLRLTWPAAGGTNTFHPMAGPWPKPPARELWEPPAGWTPPSKPAPAAVEAVEAAAPPVAAAPETAPAPKKKMRAPTMVRLRLGSNVATPAPEGFSWGVTA